MIFTLFSKNTPVNLMNYLKTELPISYKDRGSLEFQFVYFDEEFSLDALRTDQFSLFVDATFDVTLSEIISSYSETTEIIDLTLALPILSSRC